MNSKIFVFLVLSLCACAAEVKDKTKPSNPEHSKDKRQTQDTEYLPNLVYRQSRKQEATPVVEAPEDDREPVSRADSEEYRPGQVFSLNPQELLDLQPERRAPVSSNQHLQSLYSNSQPEHRQNLQQLYYLEPQSSRQVALQPSHAVIQRPHYSANGGEASVGAALSVSDSGVGSSDIYNRELLALLGQQSIKEDRAPAYQTQVQASTQTVPQQYQQIQTQSVAPQYQQVDRYITKPSKKPSKLRPKTHSHISPPQSSAAPQQYLIETTNVQAQPQQLQPQIQPYRSAPQPQRVPQALRYVPGPSPQSYVQQTLYDRPEAQGLKVVAPPNLQQARSQAPLGYRVVPQYQQQVASPKQYRILESPRSQPIRQESQRIPASSIERPVTFYNRFQEPEKNRAVKVYDPVPQDSPQQPAQIIGEKYYLRPVYRQNDQRAIYELGSVALRPVEQQQPAETPNSPHSAIYVSKNILPKKAVQTQAREQILIERPTNVDQVKIEQHGQSLEEARGQLPPPRNNRAYTPDEFAALVAAGYAVTPIPVAPVGPPVPPHAQSRAAVEPLSVAPQRRPHYRRHQYLPLRGDDAP